jgi:hypothetical protein
MNRLMACTAVVLTSLAAPVMAGDYQDKLTACLTQSATQDDKDALVRWIFLAMAAHPLTHDLATIPNDRKEAVMRTSGAVFQKLMTESCGAETMGTIKHEGTEALGKAFEVLGSTAIEGLLSHPNVDSTIAELTSYFDEKKFEKLVREHD